MQRVVLQQVLQENKPMAARLSQQHAAEKGRRTTVPDEYLCPIACQVMEDPVIEEDGQTYEREAIATWVASAGISPMTREEMRSRFISNRMVKRLIEEWRDKTNAYIQLPQPDGLVPPDPFLCSLFASHRYS